MLIKNIKNSTNMMISSNSNRNNIPRKKLHITRIVFCLAFSSWFAFFLNIVDQHVHSSLSRDEVQDQFDAVRLDQKLAAVSSRKTNSTNQVQAPKENKTWCVLQTGILPRNVKNNFDHFPHVMEVILPCWSEFIERGAITVQENVNGEDSHEEYRSNCGFFIIRDFDNYKQTVPSYVEQIIEAMGCEILYGNSTFHSPDDLPDSDESFVPNLYLMAPRFNQIGYLKRPDHAHVLRRRFVSDEFIQSKKGNGKPLQIGIIQRTKSRRILNMDDIQRRLRKALPESNIIYSEFNYTSVKDQATWFATKDVIIGSHGAAMVNSVFITPGTIVLQLYPPKWFWNTMEPLVEQAGGIAIQWYEGKGADRHPFLEFRQGMANENDKNELLEGLFSNFTAKADDVVRHVMFALGRWEPNIYGLQKLYGDGHFYSTGIH